MTQKKVKVFINGIYSEQPEKFYILSKTDLYSIDNTWSLDKIDLKGFGPEKSRGFRYVVLITDVISNFGCTLPIKKKNAQNKKDSFEKIPIASQRPRKLNESDRGKEPPNKNLIDFPNRKYF